MGFIERKDFPVAVALFTVFAATLLVMAKSLPLLPIDETRYLSVAWGMRQHGNWFLPMINTEPYSHKPPMLFWMINLMWTFFGTTIGAARVVPMAASAGVIAMTSFMARRLYPDRAGVPLLSALFLLGFPAYLLYSPLIMFDLLLCLSILISLFLIWQAAQQPSWKTWTLAGLAIGFGLLIKGPVVLLHLGPVVLFLPWWKPDGFNHSYKKWYGGFIVSVLISAGIILSWAIPAAITGGPEFARMLFWGQTAGRMVSSFDHARPFYFYIPIVFAYCLPLLCWPALWRNIRQKRKTGLSPQIKFILSWLVPTFIAFSLISGKQPHYILPLLPGVAILAADLTGYQTTKTGDAFAILAVFALLFGAGALASVVTSIIHTAPVSHIVRDGIGSFSSSWFIAGGILFGAAMVLLRRTVQAQALAMALGSGLMLSIVAVQGHHHVFPNLDLRPLAAAIQPYKDKELVYARKYEGEIGYLARLEHKMQSIERSDLPTWFDEHPDGCAIVRYKQKSEVAGYEILFTQPYRDNQFYSLIQRGNTLLKSRQ